MSLPLTVLGGYLGAGKTTLLNRMLTGDHGRRIAVIVNDFGALNVDASLIADHAGDTIALTNGCICCSAADGTATAIARILKRAADFDHIAIEASGVAEPGKVARNAAAFRLPLDGVIVLADAEQLPEQAANRYTGRAVAAQLRQADLVVLNKTDLASSDSLAASRALIARHAPAAPVIETRHADVPASVLFGAHDADVGRPDAEALAQPADHDAAYKSALFERAEPMSRAEIEALAAKLSAQAIRAKGHVSLAEDPSARHLYQQVGRRWTLTPNGRWGATTPSTRIVSIGISQVRG
ncbi:CobW family GTP-binding protein [Rubrimonas cliftonensis]|uniref:GTPase, G3E family n=1 Tax=Rubrimonas cliftonensis TaxID=89524 RepID=A0A1H4GBV0_9RHOB|nr:GTP-binding protein [Rubrimonas cliftonensis]SEB07024.1 GTPase, G3E family [Rubrimonas cliftonensis]